MFNRANWRGKDLLQKVQLISFLVIYLAFPFIISLVRADETGEIPSGNLWAFVFILIGIGFYVLLVAWMSERILRKQSEKFAGRRVLVGDVQSGAGKGEDYEFIIAFMFPYDILPQFEKDGVERAENAMLEYRQPELEDNTPEIMITKKGGKSEEPD